MLACALMVAVLAAACGEVTLDNPMARDGGGQGADAAPRPDAGPLPDAAALPDGAPPDAAACVDGDVRTVDPDTGRCYMFFQTAVPWQTALDACAALGAHLATSTERREDEVLAGLVASDADVVDVWIGGTDRAAEGIWKWIDGEPMEYVNWRDGEPNDGVMSGEDCMVMEIDLGGTWDDRSCAVSHAYFCERP